jgi:ADP-ribosyl-[dinitrogen reductase] hydrolase
MRTTTSLTLHDRVLGGLLGVAVGDALGATTEFMAPKGIKARYGVHREIVGGGTLKWRAGEPTDDTDLTLAVARAYAAGYSLDRVAANFLAWYAGGPHDIGGLTRASLTELKRSRDPWRSGFVALNKDPGSAGNGSLMRCLPTALAQRDPQRRLQETVAISDITHADERCMDACVAYNEIADCLIRGLTPLDALYEVYTNPRLGLCAAVKEALRVDPDLTPSPATLYTGGFVLDSLRCAVWAVQQGQPAEDSLIQLVNLGHDADTTGAIAGGLLGVRWGASCWPWRWVGKLETQVEICQLARQLTALREA